MLIIVIIIISTTILIAKSSVQFSTFRGSLPHSVAQTHFLENKAFGHRNTFSHVVCLLISVLVYEIQKSICRPCFLAEEKRKQILSKIEGHHMFQTLLIPLPALDTIKVSLIWESLLATCIVHSVHCTAFKSDNIRTEFYSLLLPMPR